jgi:predicted transcriptional regulator
MPIPPGAVRLTPATLAVMHALTVVHGRDGRATIRAVAAEVDRNVSTVHRRLGELRDAGLVHWEPASKGGGTLRPLVEFVPIKEHP